MQNSWFAGAAMVALSVSGVACVGESDSTSTSDDDLTAAQRARCEGDARQYAAQFLLPRRREAAYSERLDSCVRAADGDYTDTTELPLVRRRTQIASEIAARHLASLPADVKAQARCISVLSKDTIGWGLSGGGIGAGLVSCVTRDGRWSAPSYLSLTQLDLGPSIGLLDEDTTFIFTESTKEQAFRNDFDFAAGVYATAGSAHVQISADTDGCIVFDLLGRRERNCTMAVTDRVGLYAGAKVSAIYVRHMQGLFGGARVKKASARVEAYGTVDELNATIGIARATKLDAFAEGVLAQTQVDLFTLGAELACVPGKEDKLKMTLIHGDDAARLEHAIDDAEKELPPLKSFVLPGGSAQASALHLARTVCRRAERCVLAMDDVPARTDVVIYLNRLSDLLFTLARHANLKAGVDDVPWAPRAAKATS